MICSLASARGSSIDHDVCRIRKLKKFLLFWLRTNYHDTTSSDSCFFTIPPT